MARAIVYPMVADADAHRPAATMDRVLITSLPLTADAPACAGRLRCTSPSSRRIRHRRSCRWRRLMSGPAMLERQLPGRSVDRAARIGETGLRQQKRSEESRILIDPAPLPASIKVLNEVCAATKAAAL